MISAGFGLKEFSWFGWFGSAVPRSSRSGPDRFCGHCGARQHQDSGSESTSGEFGLMRVIDRLEMPRSSVPTFSGDPLSFREFCIAFQSDVGSRAVSPKIKLRKLADCCKGKAYTAIRPCFLMSPEEGYWSAWKILQERFGNPVQISRACVDALVDGPAIKPNESLKLLEFADQVKACMMTLQSIGRTSEIDSQESMVKVMRKLPFFAQTQWRKRAVAYKREKGEYPDFEAFSQFICEVALEVNDPLFGDHGAAAAKCKETGASGPVGKQSFGSKKEKGSVFNVQGAQADSAQVIQSPNTEVKAEKKIRCLQCSGDHMMKDCSLFLALKPEERFDVVRKNRLCFKCITVRHRAPQCKTGDCSTCGGSHSVILHEYFARPRPETEGKKEEVGTKEPVPGVVAACGGSGLPIVGVKIQSQSGWVAVNALLDAGSNRTLCTRALLDRLGLDSYRRELRLNVVGATVNASADCFRSVVRAADSRREVVLPEIYATEKFPLIQVKSPDVSKWSHFEHLKFPDSGLVELLIGNNVSQAFRHMEEVFGQPDEPIAVKTPLGWVLHGDCGEHAQDCLLLASGHRRA